MMVVFAVVGREHPKGPSFAAQYVVGRVAILLYGKAATVRLVVGPPAKLSTGLTLQATMSKGRFLLLVSLFLGQIARRCSGNRLAMSEAISE